MQCKTHSFISRPVVSFGHAIELWDIWYSAFLFVDSAYEKPLAEIIVNEYTVVVTAESDYFVSSFPFDSCNEPFD